MIDKEKCSWKLIKKEKEIRIEPACDYSTLILDINHYKNLEYKYCPYCSKEIEVNDY